MYRHPSHIESITVDGTIFESDFIGDNIEIISYLKNGNCIFRYNNKKYNIFIDAVSSEKGEVHVKVKGQIFKVKINTTITNLLEELGFNTASIIKDTQVFAPMPGLVLKTLVSAGQEVEEGQPLLTLEAMKMENIIKSPRHGLISEILTKDGDKVDKGDILIVFSGEDILPI